MENPIIVDSYESAKKKAEEYYGKIGDAWCPSLNDRVVFNRFGFRHLIRLQRRAGRQEDHIGRAADWTRAKAFFQHISEETKIRSVASGFLICPPSALRSCDRVYADTGMDTRGHGFMVVNPFPASSKI